MTISSNVPAHIADRMAAPTDDQIDDDARLRKRALDDLVERIMAAESYPKRARYCINLDNILGNQESNDLAKLMCAAVFHYYANTGWHYLLEHCEEIVRDYLRDTHWHEWRIAEMREEEREDHQ